MKISKQNWQHNSPIFTLHVINTIVLRKFIHSSIKKEEFEEEEFIDQLCVVERLLPRRTKMSEHFNFLEGESIEILFTFGVASNVFSVIS